MYILKAYVRKLHIAKQWMLLGLRYSFNKSIVKREGLPALLTLLGLEGKGVEIGVLRGFFSEIILKYSNLSILYSIDPWKEFDKNFYTALDNAPQDEQEKRYSLTIELLKKYKERSKILRATSQEAAHFFGTETLDFIYIDANHSYEECKNDIELWWPKLKKGGIFAGHDYLNAMFLPNRKYGIKKAVDEFIRKHKQELFVTSEEWPTWYLIKDTHASIHNRWSILLKALKFVLYSVILSKPQDAFKCAP